jgi:hypothetical protein
MKIFPCKKCIKSVRKYDTFTRTIHLFCVYHDGWFQYAARDCDPKVEWNKDMNQRKIEEQV